MTFADILTCTAKSNALINRNIITYNSCFAYDDSGSVVNEKSSSDFGTGMNF